MNIMIRKFNLKELYFAERLQAEAIQIVITVTIFTVITILEMHTTDDLIPVSFVLTVRNVSRNLVLRNLMAYK